MANWCMYTPWPFSDLFQDLGDKVQVFDFEKYNFVTPIMKPDAMERGELLDRVMHNYRRFYMKKAFLEWPWIRDKTRRKYMIGCLKAFAKSGFQRTFYDLGRVGYWGPQTKKSVDFKFADQAERGRPDAAAIAAADEAWVTMHGPKIEMRRRKGEENAALALKAIGASETADDDLQRGAVAMACGGGTEQLTEAEQAQV
jgi:anaerobic magnesium-protoporphyrin IX monomethyl ester cyclase